MIKFLIHKVQKVVCKNELMCRCNYMNYPVEVPMDDNSSEALELGDQLDEQLLHQVQKSFTERRIVEASGRRPERNFTSYDEHSRF